MNLIGLSYLDLIHGKRYKGKGISSCSQLNEALEWIRNVGVSSLNSLRGLNIVNNALRYFEKVLLEVEN